MSYRQIAIDGPAASGKSTVARLVAAALGGYYVNTGDMYRAVTWAALQRGIDPADEPERVAELLADLDLRYVAAGPDRLQLVLNGVDVAQKDIRAVAVTERVSAVARIPQVRDWMRDRQRECCRLGTVVMEGRDIGTVILPHASHKFFLTASPMERARRRLAQSGEVAPDATLEDVAAAIAERDRIDSTREVAPLKPAADAVTICTDGMTPQHVCDAIVKRICATGEDNVP